MMLTVIQQKKQYRDPQKTYEEVYKRANFTPNTNGNDSRLPKQHLTNPDSIQRFLFIDNPRTRYLVIGGTKSFALPRTTTHQALGTTTTIRIFSLIHTRLGICRILYTHCYFSSFLLPSSYHSQRSRLWGILGKPNAKGKKRMHTKRKEDNARSQPHYIVSKT